MNKSDIKYQFDKSGYKNNAFKAYIVVEGILDKLHQLDN